MRFMLPFYLKILSMHKHHRLFVLLFSAKEALRGAEDMQKELEEQLERVTQQMKEEMDKVVKEKEEEIQRVKEITEAKARENARYV